MDEKLKKIIKLCEKKINEQREREKGCGYGNDDYSDGRIVGSAALARNILKIINNTEQVQ